MSKNLIERMRAYCRCGAKALGPLLDPADDRRPSRVAFDAMRKTRRAADCVLTLCDSIARLGDDGEAVTIICAIRAHPKPQHAIGVLQDAYASPRWVPANE